MDYTFLGDSIKSRLEEIQPEKQPLCVIRGSGGFNNEPGESYVIPYLDAIYLFGRKFSDSDFKLREIELSALSDIQLHQETFSAELAIVSGSDIYKLKISSVEIPNAELMLEQFSCPQEAAPLETTNTGEIPPLLGLAVVLMFVAAVDGEIADEEQEHILRFCQNDEDFYNRAYEWYNSTSYEEFLSNLALDEQQKLCYLANILEIAMVDGVFDSKEQALIRTFVNAAELPADKVRAVEDVLLMKNQLSVL